jgi:cytoskeletal protein RodZ
VSVGEALSRARQDRGLSVADVAADTRIRATLIEGIEADNFEPCGGEVYARGHIRSIARVVGIDAAPLIAEFDAAHDVEQVPVAVAAQPTDPDIVARSDRHRPNWTLAMVVALVVICGLAAVGLVHNGGSHTPSTKAQSPRTTSTSNAPRSSPPATPPPSGVAEIPADQASMLVRATRGYTWMQVESKSGVVKFSGTLQAGSHKLFTDKHGLTFVIGNAPVVDLVINGHDIGAPHSAGNVSRGSVIPGANTVQQT